MKAQTLTISVFLSVFSMIDLNVFGAINIGNPITNIKNVVRSKRRCGKSIISIE